MISGANSPHAFLEISYCTVSLCIVALFVHFCGRELVGGVPFLSPSQWSDGGSMFHSWFEWQIWPLDQVWFWFRGQLKIYANVVTQKETSDSLQNQLIETNIYLLIGFTRSLGLVAWVQKSNIISFHAEICPQHKLKRMEFSRLNTCKCKRATWRTFSVEGNHADPELSKTRSEPRRHFLKSFERPQK